MSTAPNSSNSDDAHVLCHRCGCDLTPGRGDFYEVTITAMLDPTPGELPRSRDPKAEMRAIIRELEGSSEQELMDDIARGMTIHLCRPCYREWIEDPTR